MCFFSGSYMVFTCLKYGFYMVCICHIYIYGFWCLEESKDLVHCRVSERV